MTQEDRKLLFKDLCVRLPYGVIVQDRNGTHVLMPGNTELGTEYIKPYLRPIKSMTPEECDKLFKILDIREDSGEWLKINDISVLRLFTENGKDFYEIAEAMDYLYSIHIDFRGLIELGIAIEAPEGMYES